GTARAGFLVGCRGRREIPTGRGDYRRGRGQEEGMRAIRVSQTGGPDVLQIAEVPDPAPGPGQLQVTVTAAGVNFMDIYHREGRPPYRSQLPYIPGVEGAGVIAAVGPEVSGFAAGDTVVWTGAPGTYAEQVLVPAQVAVPVPDGISAETAAAVFLQGLTAH